MTDAFINRWTTSDGSEHGDWVIKWFEYTKTAKVPAVVQMYTDRLKHIKVTELEAVCRMLQNPDYAKPVLPGVEAILKAHRDRKKRQKERIADAKSLRKQPSPKERELAKKACNAAFANRIIQKIGFFYEFEPQQYKGEFDFVAVANAAPLPEEGQHDHSYHWSQCWRIFEEQWAAFERG